MHRLIEACNKIHKLQSIKGKNAKQDFVVANREDKDFLVLLDLRLNPYIHCKIKKFAVIVSSTKPSLTFEDFIKLTQELNDNPINNERRYKAHKALTQAPADIVEILHGLVTKTISLGIDTGINKALGEKVIPSFDVMLAAPLKEGDDIQFPCQVDLKYDGVRCLAVVKSGRCTLYTRQGSVLDFPKISHEVMKLTNGEDITFDGELETSTRTNISGICNSNLRKGYTAGSDNLIEFKVFDELPTDTFLNQGRSKKQSERTLDLQRRFTMHKSQRVKLNISETVYSDEKLRQIANAYIKRGFEGVIVKDPNAVYHYKRNRAWRKIKAINSATLKVEGYEEGKGKRKGKVGALICSTHDGRLKVKVGSGFTDEDVDVFTAKPPIGQFVEVLFNVVIKGSDDDVYSLFLPRYKEMRIDKTEADTLDKILAEHIGKPEIA